MTKVDVSVLVPVLDEERHVEEAAAAMRAQRFAGRVELIFIDGGSQDRTRAILERLAEQDERIRVLDNPARRTPNALNIGLAHARGEIVARMDAHTIYPPDYLVRGAERLARGDVAWVSGPQLAVGRGPWSRRIALVLTSLLGTGGAAFRRAQNEFEVDTGFTGLWRRATLVRHGGWDEGWPVNQDGELAARIRAAGGRIVCVPELAAEYVPRDSLKALLRQYWRYGQYRVKTSRRHPDSLRRSHVLAPGLVLACASALIPLPWLRRPGCAALAAYAATTTAVARRLAASEGAGAGETARLALVFVTMHGAWGSGFLAGCARFGVPISALLRAASGARRRSMTAARSRDRGLGEVARSGRRPTDPAV